MKAGLRQILGQPAFQVWVFILSLVLFNWPLLSIFPLERQDWLYGYLFAAWGGIILLLFLVSRGARDV